MTERANPAIIIVSHDNAAFLVDEFGRYARDYKAVLLMPEPSRPRMRLASAEHCSRPVCPSRIQLPRLARRCAGPRTPATPIHRVQAMPYSVRCAPASGRA